MKDKEKIIQQEIEKTLKSCLENFNFKQDYVTLLTDKLLEILKEDLIIEDKIKFEVKEDKKQKGLFHFTPKNKETVEAVNYLLNQK